MTFLLADSRQWRPQMAENLERRTSRRFHTVSTPDELSAKGLAALGIEGAFFPFWSHRIPASVYESVECVIFHMSDLPFGRGGSPLQNLIARGVTCTKISAVKCTEQLDAGPIYLKRPLSLEGTAEEIYLRASEIIEDMIAEIVRTSPVPVAQEGEPVVFRRRTPQESSIAALRDIAEVYDYIRMLDAPGYPQAYFETEHLRLEFRDAALVDDVVTAQVVIRRKA